MKNNRFGAIVIYPDERIQDYGNVLAIARVEAQKIVSTHENLNIKSIMFNAECNVWVALYLLPDRLLHKSSVTRRGKSE